MGFVTVKKMFGGAGIYYDGLIFGLLADDVLYLKVDDSNKSDYERAGMKPFQPFDDKPMVMPYYEVPVDILENRELLADWAMKSLSASRNNLISLKSENLQKVTKCLGNTHYINSSPSPFPDWGRAFRFCKEELVRLSVLLGGVSL